jgi:hypothetical protein
LRAFTKHGVVSVTLTHTLTQYANSLLLTLFAFFSQDKLDDWAIVAAIRDYYADSNGVIDINEWLDFEADELGIGTFHHNEWIFDIADLVITRQTITDNGTKLLQVRFCPVDTTEFILQ